MGAKIILGSLVLLVVVSGCTGTVKTAVNSADEKGLPGVIVYPPASFVDIYEKHKFVDKGKLLATSSGQPAVCKVTTVTKHIVVADYDKPQRVYYDHGILEENTFKVTLSEGILTGVNSESKPDQGKTIKAFSEALPNILSAAGLGVGVAAIAGGGVYSCNSGEIFIKRVRLSEYEACKYTPQVCLPES